MKFTTLTPEQVAAGVIAEATGISLTHETPIGDLNASLDMDAGFDGAVIYDMIVGAVKADREQQARADSLHAAYMEEQVERMKEWAA